MEQPKVRAIRRYLQAQGVKYYDVQCELIDHFATAVEKEEKENPGIPFKHALIRAHRAFGGRKGFSEYIKAAKTKVNKKTGRLFLTVLLGLFGWPDILLTVGIALFWHFLLQAWTGPFDLLYLAAMAVGGLMVVVVNYYQLRHTRLYLPRQANNYLLSIFYVAIYMPFYFTQLAHNGKPGHLLIVALFSIMTLIFICFIRIPKLAIAETLKKYPQIA